jgi:hypothetical protein
VDGLGVARVKEAVRLQDVKWRALPGGQMWVTAAVTPPA